MIGLLIGGIIWGIMGDKRGRLSVLFGSIILYSLANIATGFIQTKEQYGISGLLLVLVLPVSWGQVLHWLRNFFPKKKEVSALRS